MAKKKKQIIEEPTLIVNDLKVVYIYKRSRFFLLPVPYAYKINFKKLKEFKI